MAIHVLSEDEYEAQAFEAVLVREESVVCVDAGDSRVRTYPLSKVNHVDAPEDSMVTGTELPGWFYGGGQYGFVDVESFPDLAQHLEELQAETA